MTDESERLWASRPAPHRIIQQAAVKIGKARVLIAIGIGVICFGFGMVAGVRLTSYRGQVVDEDFWALRKSHAELVKFVQARFPKSLTITKVQAQSIVGQLEKDRE